MNLMKTHEPSRSYGMRAAYIIATLPIFLVIGCASTLCRQSSGDAPWVSVSYRTTDAVGLIQEIHLFEDGLIRLNAANLERYCSRLSSSARSELVELLDNRELVAQLGAFGEKLRYPECFIPEKLTITIGGRRATARIDALEGELLALVEQLETASREQFGQKYMISLIERATHPPC